MQQHFKDDDSCTVETIAHGSLHEIWTKTENCRCFCIVKLQHIVYLCSLVTHPVIEKEERTITHH